MKITVKRIFNSSKYCISRVYAGGNYVCDAIEDVDRGLDSSMTTDDIFRRKVYAQTAIPVGTYEVTLNVVSPKFNKKPYYNKFCGGRLPRVLNVKGFDGILWHIGKDEKSSAGCLILGYNTIKGQVTNSQQAFEKLYRILQSASRKGERITAEYTRTYKV